MNKQQTIELMNGYKLPADKFKLVIEIDRLEKIDDEKRRTTGTLNSEIREKINALKMLFQPAEIQALYLNNWRQ